MLRAAQDAVIGILYGVGMVIFVLIILAYLLGRFSQNG